MEAKYVVVGGGIAGVSCVETISILEPDSSIILIAGSPVVKAVTTITPYGRVLAEFVVEEKSHSYVMEKNTNVKIVRDAATSFNSRQRLVRTAAGDLKYEKLCICTGASPKTIASNAHVITVRDTDSAETLEKRLETATRVMIVGNGGIASELAYEIGGVEIIWAIKDKHINSVFVDPGAACFFDECIVNGKKTKSNVKKWVRYTVDSKSNSELKGPALGPSWHERINLTKKGARSKIIVEYSVEVKSIIDGKSYSSTDNDKTWPVYVELTNGNVYGCDFVISATGVIPNGNTVRPEDAEFELAEDGGIKVNDRLETNIEHVFAAGDVCTASWPLAQHWLQMRLWTQARQFGCYAARCLIAAVKNEPILMDFAFEMFTHVTKFFGFKVIILGLFNGQKLESNYEIMLRTTPGMEYIKLIIKDGRLQGAILIGDTDLEEMCENLILDQLDISVYGEDLLNPDLDIDDYFD